ALGVLRADRPGSGGEPGEADRGAVGRRPGGQLRPGTVPGAVAGMERPGPRLHARPFARGPRPRPPGRPPAQPLPPPLPPSPPAHSVSLLPGTGGSRARAVVRQNQNNKGPRGGGTRGGGEDTRSWRGGAGAPRDDAGATARPPRQSRAMLTTLLLSFGMPLLL